MLYEPVAAPAKVEEKKPDAGPSPYGDPNTEYYVRELDGLWSLRTASEVHKDCRPGFWMPSESGWPIWIREKP